MSNDIILTIVSILFSYSLIPQIKRSYESKRVDISWQTLIITIFGYSVVSYVNFDLGLYLNSIITILVVVFWCVLGIMKFKYFNCGGKSE
jgi:hypothetical protein